MRAVEAVGPASQAVPFGTAGPERQRLFRDMLFRRKGRSDGDDADPRGDLLCVFAPATLPVAALSTPHEKQPRTAEGNAARLGAAHDSVAQCAAQSGTLVAMASRSGEYQIELNLSVISRTRLRVRAGAGRALQVICESDNAGEREWFSSHQAELAARIRERTGQDAELVVAQPR